MKPFAWALFCLFLAYQHSAASSIATISTWKDDKPAAVSIVYDDNSANQFEFAQPLMDARDIRGTFFVVPKWCGSVWDSIRNASRNGHEIGSHTLSHPNMATLPDSDLILSEKELKDSRDSIEKMLPGVKCLTLAWPGNKYSKKAEELAAKYYISARQGAGTFEVASPADFFAVRSIPFADTAVAMNRYLDEAIEKKRWLIELLHRVHPTPYPLVYTNNDSLRVHLDYLVSKRGAVWIAPYGEIIRYIMERDSSAFSVKSLSDSQIVLSLSNKRDTARFNLPLSLSVRLPEGASAIAASQNGDSLRIAQVEDHGHWILKMAAYPNKGDINVRVHTEHPTGNSGWRIERKADGMIRRENADPNTIYFRAEKDGQYTLRVMDFGGREIGEAFRFDAEANSSYHLRMKSNPSIKGRYIVAIYSGSKPIAKRNMVLE
jgi:oligosaccharide reducing-end xylanase